MRDRFPFGGFPWGRWAFSQAESPLRWFAALGGAPLVTFAVALSGALLAEAVLLRPRAGCSGERDPPAGLADRCPGRRAAGGAARRRAVLAAAAGHRSRPDADGRRDPGRRARSRAGVQRPAPAGAGQPRPADPAAGRRGPGRHGGQAGPGALAGERLRHRPDRQPGCRPGHPAGGRRGRRADPGRRHAGRSRAQPCHQRRPGLGAEHRRPAGSRPALREAASGAVRGVHPAALAGPEGEQQGGSGPVRHGGRPRQRPDHPDAGHRSAT